MWEEPEVPIFRKSAEFHFSPAAPGELIIYLLLWAQQALTFLLSHRPAELATKYANFSEGACKPGYASALMTAIFPR